MGFLSKLLGVISGDNGVKISEQLLFDKVIGFRGIVSGVGTSTVVQNVAYALSETTNYDICVLDTNFLYPTQYPMLVSSLDERTKDFLDFSGDLADVSVATNARNVHLVSLSKRTIVDMLSSKDNELVIDNLMGALKTRFDIILVDLSHEFTNININTAIRCNKVINVADQSLKCIYNLGKSLNTMVTLAVPLGKANKVVLNKVLPDVVTNTRGVMEEAGLRVLGEIPFSLELAKHGASGKRIFSASTSNQDIHDFSKVIMSVLDEIVQVTPLNEKYTDPIEVEKSKSGNGSSPIIIDDSEDIDIEVSTSSKHKTSSDSEKDVNSSDVDIFDDDIEEELVL